MNVEQARLEENMQSLSVQESSSTFIGIPTCISLTMMFIR